MKRFRDDRPADICFARGTFNSHPYVMGGMNEFLHHLQTPDGQALYRDLDGIWNERARQLNERLRDEGAAGRGGQYVLDLDRLLYASRPATTGCCNITCAPKAWR